MDFNDNELTRMSKRRFLKVASGMGVSAASLQYGTQEGLAQAADEDTVPYVEVVRRTEDGGEEPIYAQIARDEWEVRHTADDAAQQVGGMVVDQGWNTSLVRPTFHVDGNGGFHVEVEYKTLVDTDGDKQTPEPSHEEVRRELPNTVKGEAGKGEHKATRQVPVIVREQREEKVSCMDTDTRYDENVGGAQPCYCFDTQAFSTVCSWFDHDNYGKGVLVSGHAFNDLSGIDGHEMEYDVQYRGTAKDGYDGNDVDWAFVKIDVSGGFATIAMSNGSNTGRFEEMMGKVPNSTLKNDAGSSTTYYKRGRATCQKSGGIAGVAFDGWSCEFDKDSQGGDSGGPVFKKKGTIDEAYIAGLTVADKTYGGTKATTADKLETEAPGSFV